MFTLNKNFGLLVGAPLLLAFGLGCSSSAKRNIAGEFEPIIAQPRVNPVVFPVEAKWEIMLHDGAKNNWDVDRVNLIKHSLRTPQDRVALAKYVSGLWERNNAEKEKPDNKGFLPKDSAFALREILNLLPLLDEPNIAAPERAAAFVHISEIAYAFNNNFLRPMPKNMWVGAVPFRLLSEIKNPPMAEKSKDASNLTNYEGDLSLIDPPASSFWQPVQNLSERNMFYGFGRKKIPAIEEVCTYESPKKSYGTHGGFEIACKDQKMKIKFGIESHTEPFVSRLFYTLGYPAKVNDYVNDVKLVYDRKVLTEYNKRKDILTNVKSLLGFSYFKRDFQQKLDPFVDAVKGAVLVDNRVISSPELAKLILSPKNGAAVTSPALKDADFNPEAEKQVKYLILQEGNMEYSRKSEKDFGPWGWNDLDHPNRRELRGFGVIAAYLNFYDARVDNNRLAVRTLPNGERMLVHYVSDMGNGLSRADGLTRYAEIPANAYPWDFIKKGQRPAQLPSQKGPVDWYPPYEVVRYSILGHNEAFRRIKIDDIKWASRLLAQVTEEQFQDGLIAAGHDAATVKLLVEKLVSRRQDLIKTFGLEKEFPAIANRPVDPKFNYDPRLEALPVSKSSKKQAPVGAYKIVSGELVKL